MTSDIGWGIIGAGEIAKRFARDIKLCSGSRLAGVASRSSERAQGLMALAGTKAGGKATDCAYFETYAAMLASPEIDAIYIALPTAMHVPVTLEAIAAGKPVLCEKPLSLDAAEAAEVAKAAKAASVLVMEAMWTRFLPNVIEARALLNSGAIGTPLHLQASMGFPADDLPGKSIADPALGGGAIRDLGVYPMSLAQYFLGPLELSAAQVRHSSRGTDRDMSAVLRGGAAGACLVSLSASHSGVLPNRLEITGTEGRLTLEAPFLCGLGGRLQRFAPVAEGENRPGTVAEASAPAVAHTRSLKTRLKQSKLWRRLRHLLRGLGAADGKAFGSVYEGTGLQFQIDAFAQLVRQGAHESDLMPLSESVEIAVLLEKIAQGEALPKGANTRARPAGGTSSKAKRAVGQG